MCAISQQSDTTPAARAGRHVTLVVELDPAAENALLRVLTLLARRRCTVTRADFRHDLEAACDVLSVDVDAPPHMERNIAAWVSALVPVRSAQVRAIREPPRVVGGTEPYGAVRRNRMAASAYTRA